MIGVMVGLLAGIAYQPAIIRPAPPLVRMDVPPSMVLPPMPEGPPPAVRATGQLAGLFSTDDYPAAALRNGEQGTVAITVAINAEGRVSGCAIRTSSGSAVLDAATGSIIHRRARFTPARDASGRPIEDRTDARIRWMLPPQVPMPFADQRMALVFTINPEGMVSTCRVEGIAKTSNNDALCARMMNEARSMAADAAKKFDLANRELVLEQGVLIGGPDAAREVGLGSDKTRGNLFAVALDIDATGTISNCVAAEGIVEGPRVMGACGDSRRSKFVPLDPAAANQSARHAVRYWVSYTRPIE